MTAPTLLPPERLAVLLIELRERAEAAKHSPWTFSPQEGEPKHCDQAQIWDENGHSLAVLEPTLVPQLATDTAAHIAGLHPEIVIALLDHITALTREGDERLKDDLGVAQRTIDAIADAVDEMAALFAPKDRKAARWTKDIAAFIRACKAEPDRRAAAALKE